jgi:hypothetical protein
MSVRIVAPVVVTPETASNNALEYPLNAPDKWKGIEPKIAAEIQHKTITKNTSLFEKDLAFLDKNQTGRAQKIEIEDIWKRYKLAVSKYSIVAGIKRNTDKTAIKIDKSLNVGLRLIIQI